MRKNVYEGTAEQALALANMNAQRWIETQDEAKKYANVKEAMENLISEVDCLQDALRYPNRSTCLDALFMFSTIEQALDIVRIKCDQVVDNDSDDDEDE
jgi:hypothetical protein